MLPVNIAHEDQTTVSPFSVAVKRQAIASTVYSSTGTEKYSITVLFAIYYLLSKKSKTLFQVL